MSFRKVYKMSEEDLKYVLVTPARNEEKMLPDLAECVVSQSVRPVVWVIVDDNSSDGTGKVIKILEEQYDWIKSIHHTYSKNIYGFDRYTSVVQKGIEETRRICSDCHVGKIDADTKPSSQFFEKLLNVINNDDGVGIISGLHIEDGIPVDKGYPREGGVIFEKRFFDGVGEYLNHSPMLIKAEVRGWKTLTVEDAVIEHQRKIESNTRRSLVGKGFTWYYLGASPINAFLQSIKYALTVSPVDGFMFFKGYFKSFVMRDERMRDTEVRDYFKNKSVLRRVFKKLH